MIDLVVLVWDGWSLGRIFIPLIEEECIPFVHYTRLEINTGGSHNGCEVNIVFSVA